MTNEIDYKALADKLRERYPSPRGSMPPKDYYTAEAIHALAWALDQMDNTPQRCGEPCIHGGTCSLDKDHGNENHEARDSLGIEIYCTWPVS